MRTVLEAVGDNSNKNVVALLNKFTKSRDGQSHGIVQRCTAIRLILLRSDIRDRVDLLTVNKCPDKRPAGSGVESDKGYHLMVVGILLLRSPDGLQRLVGTAQCLFADVRHGSAFIQNNQVVDTRLPFFTRIFV